MSKDKLIGYTTPLENAKCSFCKGKEELNQYELADTMKGLPVTKIYYVCKSCAKKKGLLHYPNINL